MTEKTENATAQHPLLSAVLTSLRVARRAVRTDDRALAAEAVDAALAILEALLALE